MGSLKNRLNLRSSAGRSVDPQVRACKCAAPTQVFRTMLSPSGDVPSVNWSVVLHH